MKKKQGFFIGVIALIAGLIGGIISSHFFVGQPVFAEKKPNDELRVKSIRTQALILENEAGEIRAFFNLQKPDDFPLLMMFGKSKTFKPGESISVAMELNTKGGAGTLSLYSEDKGRIVLSGGSMPGPTIRFFGPNSSDSVINMGVMMDPDDIQEVGNPFFFLGNPFEIKKNALKMGRSIMLSLKGKEEVRISLSDTEGNTRAVLGSETTETIKTGAITKNPPSSLVLYNKKGRVIWSAP